MARPRGGFFAERAYRLGQREMWPGGQGAVLELALQLQQAERDQLLRDQGIEIPAVEGSEDYLDFVQATGDACHLGDARQVRYFEPDPPLMNGHERLLTQHAQPGSM